MQIDVIKVNYHELYPVLADRINWETFEICFEVL